MTEHPKALVALTTSNQWHAKFLRRLMGSRFHHCCLFVHLPPLGGWMAINTDIEGTHAVSTKKVFKKITDFQCYYSSENLFEGIQFCRDKIGLDYDSKGVFFGTLILFFEKLFRMRPKRMIQNPSKMFCIEYIASVLKYSNVPLFNNVDVSFLSPLDLEELVERDPTLTKIDISKEELLNE